METLKIDAATLAADAAWIAKGKAARSYVPVLATTHVTVTSDGLRLRMTDYDMFREVTVPAENGADSDVAVLVDPAKLAAFLKGAKGDALVSVDVDGIEIAIGARTVKISAAAGDIADYPAWLEFGAADSAVVELALLKRALVSVGKDATLPMLTGVRFEDGSMATTDRFRLTWTTYAAAGFTALIPADVFKPFTVGKGAVSVEFGNVGVDPSPSLPSQWVRVSRDNRSVIGRALDAEFPKWRQLISGPQDNAKVVAEIRRADLLDALAGDNVDLELHADAATMTVHGRENHGDVIVSQTIAADVATDDGLPFTVRMNTSYLAAALKSLDSDVVTLTATTPVRPVLFTAGETLHLLMPQRIPA